VDVPSDNDERPSSGGSRSRVAGFPVVRAGLVLVLFVVATVLLLASIHPSPAAVPSNAVAATTTSTTTSTASSTVSSTTHPGTKHHGSTTTTTIPPRPPANVPVLVANGSGVTGAAAAFSARLQSAGWSTLPPTNATVHVPTSHVYYLAGQQTAAAAVATTLHLPTSSVAPYTTAAPVSTIGTADVLVVIGPDIASSSSVGTAPTTTSTTASHVSTTG
jgi:LytR cell envelope-related transcriptional attenuator